MITQKEADKLFKLITEFADAKRDEGRSYQEYLDNKVPIETWQHVDQIAEKYFNKMLKYLDSLREATAADDKPATNGDLLRQGGNRDLAEYFVYEIGAVFASTLIVDKTFDTYDEAIEATEAYLNAPAKEREDE